MGITPGRQARGGGGDIGGRHCLDFRWSGGSLRPGFLIFGRADGLAEVTIGAFLAQVIQGHGEVTRPPVLNEHAQLRRPTQEKNIGA